MAKTQISDVIVPAVFAPYVTYQTAVLSEIIQSGIVVSDPKFDAFATGEGQTVNMPYWNDLSGNSQVLSDSSPLVPKKIDTAQDVAVIYNRGDAWSANQLAKWLAGSDPMAAIGQGLARYWARDLQTHLLNVMTGIFAAASMSGNVNAAHATAINTTGDRVLLTGSIFADSLFKLGDASAGLAAVVVHSDIMANWVKANAIQYIQPSDNAPLIPTYMGKRVIVDDQCPRTQSGLTGTLAGTSYIYTSYIFGPGAIALGNGTLDANEAVETDRDTLAGDDFIINRKRYILHPRGVKWLGASMAGSSPTNAEAATSSNWSRVWENKKIRIVKVTTNG